MPISLGMKAMARPAVDKTHPVLQATAVTAAPATTDTPVTAPAFWNVHPELCHNEVAGWGLNGDATRQLVTLVNLRHDAEHPQVSRRFDLTTEVLREVMADVVEVRAEGEGDLAQLLDLVLVGDVVSLLLAAHEGVDPGPVPTVDDMKAALAGGA